MINEATYLAHDVARKLIEVTGYALVLPCKRPRLRRVQPAHVEPSVPIEKIREVVSARIIFSAGRELTDAEFEEIVAECPNMLCRKGTVPLDDGRRTWCIECARRTDAARGFTT